MAAAMAVLVVVVLVLGCCHGSTATMAEARWENAGPAGSKVVSSASLILLNDSHSQSLGAFCLDGSAPGYYVRPGSGANASRLLVHFLGGGWCWSVDDCAARSEGNIGSSSSWTTDGIPSTFSAGGIMDALESDYGNYTLLYVMYCDGSSYTSNASQPYAFNATKSLYFRGRRILQALTDHWATVYPSPPEVIVTGSSAGGLTVYLHLDAIAAAFPASTRVLGMVDAGFFLNHSNTNGVYAYGDSYAGVRALWGVDQTSFDSGCVQAHGSEFPACFFASEAFPHMATPVFVTNSAIDAWQMGNVLQVGCTIGVNSTGGCSAAQLASIAAWRGDFLEAINEVIEQARANPHQTGVFIDMCPVHTETCGPSWFGYTAQAASMAAAFRAWRAGTGESVWEDSSALPWEAGFNPTCAASPGGWC
ncbi:uncharacterized protein MONBRDRAFT_33119 [Monosiga brevicollis MX1]|uniref:Pectin acetylesterase n=1 Tax=Monosiga brevicollis TaxID=81824 RepID=A9V3T2_MONBE|nr:uncharacterized protein MONBRDRAFT_33119 [Monosiga brevicollis MX1]EDQ87863.1 predicted protein [Monosiga brevicollis MX1]|eukprot:XP_001747396.1 hypothetical protein [Monosiga brevicollis MX1]